MKLRIDVELYDEDIGTATPLLQAILALATPPAAPAEAPSKPRARRTAPPEVTPEPEPAPEPEAVTPASEPGPEAPLPKPATLDDVRDLLVRVARRIDKDLPKQLLAVLGVKTVSALDQEGRDKLALVCREKLEGLAP